MMVRIVLLLSIFITASLSLSAQRYMTRSGHIWFFSHTPIEDIEAHNYQANSIFDLEKGEFAFSLLMKGFQFEKALMQEHFNEKYMESDKHPKSTFKGKIENLDAVNLTETGEHKVNIKGVLDIHGVSKEIETPAILKVQDSKIEATADFSVKVEDFKIKIPGVVKDNIAETILIHVIMNYEKM